MRAYQKILPQIRTLGAALVAISPQTPDRSQATLLNNFLEYEVLSDLGNRVAKQFGLVYSLAAELRPVYESFGVHLPEYNGDDTWELPLPGTFVISRDATIQLAFVDTDFTNLLEPAAILECLRGLPPFAHNGNQSVNLA